MQLEHATLPPYLTALYSIHPGTNSDAFHILRVVAVEEMLHLTLAANLLNAVGGTPDLTAPGFVPDYPARLPDGEQDFEVGLAALSPATVETFLKIERPALPPDERSRTLPSAPSPDGHGLLAARPTDADMHFYSIGEFYAEIDRGLVRLAEEQGEDRLFEGDPARQVTSEYFYSGGGEIIPVVDLASARAAARLIAEQGEGKGGGIYDHGNELAHYYRFEQLKLGRYYLKGDQPGDPTGPRLDVDWDAVFPIRPNARLTDYLHGSGPSQPARGFNVSYAAFLRDLTVAFSGRPAHLFEAVCDMFILRERATRLIQHPLHDQGNNAAPTFEIPGSKEAAG
jgi:hypothetical protein